MEGINWFRMSIIGLLFAVSAYVLLPTVLQVDPVRGEEASSGPVLVTQAAPDLALEIEVEGDLAAAATAIERRLDEAGVQTERVREDAGRVQVVLTPGSSRADVEEALSWPGVVGVHSLTDVAGALGWEGTTEPSADLAPVLAEALAAVGGSVDTLQGTPLPGSVPNIAQTEVGVGHGDSLRLPLTAHRDSEEPVIISIDGVIVAMGLGSNELSVIPLGDQGERIGQVLRSGPLPAGASLIAAEALDEAEAEEDADVEADTETNIPPALRALLPDTRMNLGIDLQGGLDLTLQVELDQAVLSQATRDASSVADRAAEDGLVVSDVAVDAIDPILFVTAESSLQDVQRWFARNLADYEYSETSADGVHHFEMTTARVREVHDQSVDQVLETLRKRVDATGVKEPSIVRKTGGRISVQLPGKVDLDQAIDAIGTTAVLEFNLVDPDENLADTRAAVRAAEVALPADQFNHDPTLNTWLVRNSRIPSDRKVMFEYVEDAETGVLTRNVDRPYLVMREVMLTGADVNDARVSWDRQQRPVVLLDLKPRGGQIFCSVTTDNVGELFAISLDGQVSSAPSINERICGGSAQISMGNSIDATGEANNLALVLRTGSLDAPVSIGEIRTVGALLGSDAIRSGSIATLIGSIVVLLFMVIWYRKAGLLADIALVLNVLLVLATLAMFGATLTLPGIAGIALTIGMAVDANIIIYERIREELAMGQLVRKAVDAGFDKGLVAVVDANITTAIAGIVLYSYGTGPVKGFAVTLLVGIVTTLITALFVTRTLMEMATRSSSARLRL